MIEDHRRFLYRINADDQIVFANQDWFDFAIENHSDLGPELVFKRPVWSFIADSGTKAILSAVIQRVRQNGRAIRLPFRCDSPDLRRHMEIEIRLQPDDHVEFESRVLRLESRDPVQLWSPEIQRSNQVIIACSWCKKIQVSRNNWMEVEESIAALGLFNAPLLPRVSHGVCPLCAAEIKREIDNKAPHDKAPRRG